MRETFQSMVTWIGLWESLAICLGFSVVVIAIDEWAHARRRRNRAAADAPGH